MEKPAGRAADGRTYFGKYTISGNVVNMEGFGKMTLINATSASIEFSVMRDGQSTAVPVTASKQAEMQHTTNTDLLCRTWIAVDEIIPGYEDYKNTYDEAENLTVLFSAAGTYLVYSKEFEEEIGGPGLAQWRWHNTAQNKLDYTWNWDDWTSDVGIVEFPILTKDKLVVIERYHNEDDEITVLRPAQ